MTTAYTQDVTSYTTLRVLPLGSRARSKPHEGRPRLSSPILLWCVCLCRLGNSVCQRRLDAAVD